jgi:hypothetical protein
MRLSAWICVLDSIFALSACCASNGGLDLVKFMHTCYDVPNLARGDTPLRTFGEDGGFLTRMDSTALIIRVFPTIVAVALLTSPEVTMSTRQHGQSSLLSSHSRIQSLWNRWLQYFGEWRSLHLLQILALSVRKKSTSSKTARGIHGLAKTYCNRWDR